MVDETLRQAALKLAAKRAGLVLFLIAIAMWNNLVITGRYGTHKLLGTRNLLTKNITSAESGAGYNAENDAGVSVSTRHGRILAAKKLRVVLIANQYKQQFPLVGYGGVEAAVETIAETLHESGVNFTVITPVVDTPPEVPYEYDIRQTPHCRAPCDPATFAADAKDIIRGLDPRPDVIWGQSDWSGRYLHDLNVPMIVTNHDSGNGERIRLKRNCSHVMNRFVSGSQLEVWSERKPWLRGGDDAFVLWEGFRPDEFRLYRDKVPKTALFVGRLIREKGIQEFMLLARWNPDWTFLCYGPNLKVGFEQRLPANVKYMGELKRGEAHREAFGKSSRFFMYVTDHEAFGRTVVEAMSKGTPRPRVEHGLLARTDSGSGRGRRGSRRVDFSHRGTAERFPPRGIRLRARIPACPKTFSGRGGDGGPPVEIVGTRGARRRWHNVAVRSFESR